MVGFVKVSAITKVLTSSIPPLQRTDCCWAFSDKEKAEEFADTFAKKAFLPDAVLNQYSNIPTAQCLQPDFFVVRIRRVRQVLKALRANSATGPDGLSARILKSCASSLATPIRLLAQQILREQLWPNPWRFHWVFPLHKKKSKAQAKHYRGIHLTPQISKVIERVLGDFLKPWARCVSRPNPNSAVLSTAVR